MSADASPAPAEVITTGLASDLEVMTRLHQLSTRLIRAGELNLLLGEIIETALDLTGADKGNIQLLQDGVLRTMEHRGLNATFLDFFNSVDHGKAVCGSTPERNERVIVENVATSSIFAGTPALDVMLAAEARALQSTPLVSRSGQTLGMFSTHYATPQWPSERDLRVIDILARQAADLIERSLAERALRDSEHWRTGQKEAFQAAVNGAALEASLGILTRTAVEQYGGAARCAFYIADASGRELRHVVGMPDAYARCVEGFKIGPDSLACGLAVYRGQPVVTPDVFKEPLWKEWVWLAAQFDYRACWSFPVETSTGKIVGSFAMYFKEPREAGSRDHALAASLTHAASIIICQAQEVEERKQAEEALRTSERQLAEELAATQRLQEISTCLIAEDEAELLYEHLLDAAVTIMRSDYASMQMLYPERGENGEFRLLAFSGLNPQAAKFWEWVSFNSESTSCGIAFRNRQRVIVPDVEKCEFMAGTEDLTTYLCTGIHAIQSTPLLSRDGEVVGMISTHWGKPHEPTQRDLRLFDILARQAADLIERKRAKDQLNQEVTGLRALHEVGTRLLEVRDVDSLLKEVLVAAGDLTGSNVGTLQLMDESTGALKIEAQQGLPPAFIEFFDQIHGDDAAVCETALAHGGQAFVEDVEQRIRSVQSTPIMTRSGQLSGMLSTHYRSCRPFSDRDLHLLELLARQAADLIERARAEEKLHEANAELARANEELDRTTRLVEPVACFVRDLQDRIIYWNPGAADLYGFSKDEAIGQVSHSLLKTKFPEPLDHILAQVKIAGAWNGELLHTHRDGRLLTVASRWTLHTDAKGGPTTILAVNLDITRRKKAEEQLRITNEALLRANEDLNQFAFAASHDLQEPLRMITGYSQLLLKGYSGQLDGEAATCIEFITEGTKRMRGLLADLLAYTQLSGDLRETPTLVDLNVVFQTALENCKAAADEAGAIVTGGVLPSVLGQKPHFVQLFQNLISNGLKYRGEQPPRLHASAERQNRIWRIAVKDNGVGIAREYHKQIFGVFKRLHGKDIPGTGIGLAICQRIVDRCGGQIWVESQPGEGATFYFTLPIMENEASLQ